MPDVILIDGGKGQLNASAEVLREYGLDYYPGLCDMADTENPCGCEYGMLEGVIAECPPGDLYCIDLNTQKPVWKKNVWTDFGGKPAGGSGGFRSRGPDSFPIWAITQCPLVYGDLVIVASQAPQAGVVAFDKLTGELL